MQAENLNAQVAAQVCMDLRGSPCFEVTVGGLWWAGISLDQRSWRLCPDHGFQAAIGKKSQRWVFSGLAEQMTDMLPSSALFIHFSP